MSKKEKKIDSFWEAIMLDKNILEVIKKYGNYIISNKEIGYYHQSRLMVKFDNYNSLPNIFKQNNLSILPISNTRFIISHYNIFHKIEDYFDQVKHRVFLPNFIKSISSELISSEAMAINAAYISGIFSDFLNLEQSELFLTVNGRQRVKKEFNYQIQNTQTKVLDNITVENTHQMEIDAAYETPNELILIEAKLWDSDNFGIRQIFYPYEVWKRKVTKKVRNIFMTYSNNIFVLREYAFEKDGVFNSLKLIKSKEYIFEPEDQLLGISLKDIETLLEDTKIESEPNDIPLPQADSMNKIIGILEFIKRQNSSITKNQIKDENVFDIRQADYYLNAAKYLGLVENIQNQKENFILTEDSKILLDDSFYNRQVKIVKKIISHKIYNKVLRETLKKSDTLEVEEIIKIIKENDEIWNYSDETYKRRANTAKSWITWIINLSKLEYE